MFQSFKSFSVADGFAASAVVQVNVNDVNDNDPRFEPKNYALQVESTVSPGPLLVVQGQDDDSGPFGTVEYSFVDDNGFGYFEIDSGSGKYQYINCYDILNSF